MLIIAIAIPIYSAFAVKPKPKILIRMDLPLHSLGTGSTKTQGDKIVFEDASWDAGGAGASIMIFQWLPNPDPGPTHIPAPSVFPAGPLTHQYSGGEIYATAHGIRDAYTMTGTWHMEFEVSFDTDNNQEVDSGFTFKHTCNGVGLIHAASWDGSGFGAFEGMKVSGVSIADIAAAMQSGTPVTKILFGEAKSGFDSLPPRNIPPLS